MRAIVPRMTMPLMVALPDLDVLDSEKLKTLIIEKHARIIEKEAELASQHDEIERLKLFITKLQRMQFGPSSEKLAPQIDQLELQLEDLETAKATRLPTASPGLVAAEQAARKPLPADLPRETETFAPKEN